MMLTSHPPFHFLQTELRNKWMKVAVVWALVLTAVFSISGRPLNTDAAPSGIVSFEFAGTVENAQAMIDSWDQHAKLVAALSLGLDFLYPLVYASAISLTCIWAADRVRLNRAWLADVGIWLAWGVWVAALLDYIENYALVALLLGSTATIWPLVAFVCATIKFILVIVGILYVLTTWLVFRAGSG